MARFLFCVTVILLNFVHISYCLPFILRGRVRGGFVGSPKTSQPLTGLPGDQWLSQTLDHFNDADTRRWQQVNMYVVDEDHVVVQTHLFLAPLTAL